MSHPTDVGAALRSLFPSGVVEVDPGRRWSVRPDNSSEVSRILALASEIRVPVRPSEDEPRHWPLIELDLSGLSEIHSIDEEALMVHAGAGLKVRDLEAALRDHGFTLGFPLVPHLGPKLGGFLSTEGWAESSVEYGRPGDSALGIEGILPTGRKFCVKPAPRRAVGPDIAQLFLGAEGALGILTDAWVRFHAIPKARKILAASFPDVRSASKCAARVVHEGARTGFGRILDAPIEGPDRSGPVMVLGFEGEARLAEVFHGMAARLVHEAGGTELPEDHPLAVRQVRTPCADMERADHLTASARWSAVEAVMRAAGDGLGGSMMAVRVSDLLHEGCSITWTCMIDRSGMSSESAPAVLVDAAGRVRESGGTIVAWLGPFRARPAGVLVRDPGFDDQMASLRSILDPGGILG